MKDVFVREYIFDAGWLSLLGKRPGLAGGSGQWDRSVSAVAKGNKYYGIRIDEVGMCDPSLMMITMFIGMYN
jgi:hypothetical protein